MEEVAGSIPASSTSPLDESEYFMLGGFVAGEGCFTTGVRGGSFADGSPMRKFIFCIEVADRDVPMLERLADAVGCGSIRRKPSRRGHLPSAMFSVRSHKAHHDRTIPFMDRYLLPSAKRRQFEMWKRALGAYEELHPTSWGRVRLLVRSRIVTTQCAVVASAAGTTTVQPATEHLGAWIGGFVAAEGCFVHVKLPTKQRFTFQVALGAVDGSVCEDLLAAFGVGRIVTYSRRRPHYDDEVAFVVTRLRELVEVIVPFMDEHLPASHKRVQYEAWRSELLDYWEHQARRKRPCRMTRCTAAALAHGLCRSHLWSEMGR